MKGDMRYPNILVISANAFSNTSNNGKTLASFFMDYPSESIAQLYFYPEIPGINYFRNFFRVTDNDIFYSLISKKYKCGCKITDFDSSEHTINNNEAKSRRLNFRLIISRYNITRIIREILWKSKKWKTDDFNKWLDDFKPELIFLCAGDGVFTYDITKYIKVKYGSKLIVYITDDYVLPRKTLSPFWWIRRNLILSSMKSAVSQADLFITISPLMQQKYKDLFNKESILAVNMTKSLKDETIHKNTGDEIILVYAGGLHYKRYQTLYLLGKAIAEYNSNQTDKKAQLYIYSGQVPSRVMMKYLNVENASKFCGFLNPHELKVKLNSCDIPVHVESFNIRCIESTRLSLSTKLPEYLSLGKPVLAIGPGEIASMQSLKDCAYCITDKKRINELVNKLFREIDLNLYANKAIEAYESLYNRNEVSKLLQDNILRAYYN